MVLKRSGNAELDRATCRRFIRSESWELERRRREIECLDNTLISQLQELDIRRGVRSNRYQKIDEITSTINECLPQFEKFMQTVQRKHEASMKKYTTEKEFLEVNREEVNCLSQEHEFLSTIRAELLERLEGFAEAQKYLLAVKNESQGKFSSVRGLINAFTLLSDNRKSTFDSIDQMNSEIRERQDILENLSETDGQEQLKLLNHLHDVEEKRNELDKKVRSLQREFASVHEITANKCMQSGKMELAYTNLYAQLCAKLDPTLYVESATPSEQKALIKIAFDEIHKLRDNVHHVVSPKSSLAAVLSTTSNSNAKKNGTGSKGTKKKQILK